jgi:hypothetical protein
METDNLSQEKRLRPAFFVKMPTKSGDWLSTIRSAQPFWRQQIPKISFNPVARKRRAGGLKRSAVSEGVSTIFMQMLGAWDGCPSVRGSTLLRVVLLLVTLLVVSLARAQDTVWCPWL